MSPSDRMTQSKGEPTELSLPTRTRQRRKSPSREAKPEIEQQPTGFAEGLDQLQQEAVVHISPLAAQQPRPASSQSITGPITGDRPCSRALSVMGMDESRPQSTPPLVDHHQQSQIWDTPQVPFQQTSQNFESHLLQLSVPLFTEDRYSTSTDNNEEIVMQKSPPLQDGGCHHKQLLWLCHQQDQSQHLPWWITLPRVIQTKWYYKETVGITKTIQ